MTFISKAANHSGVMVALYPSPETAAVLSQPGGEPASDLHLTLAYLGEARDLSPSDIERLRQTVAEFAASTAPIDGLVSGIGLFTAGPEPVTYASVDAPGLESLRESLCDRLSWDDLKVSRDHGFTPHITLAYDERNVPVPNLPLAFDAITLKVGDERTDFPLYGVRKDDVVLGGASPLWKAQDTAERIVYGVVLHPGVVDSQGDIVSAEEIRKAAHRWLAESRLHDLQHDETEAPIVPVESFIAHADLQVAGRPVLKGAWVMASLVNDDAIWADVCAERITGYSIGGSGVRLPA